MRFFSSRFFLTKSFDALMILKRGITEIRTDKMGRKMKFVDWKRVPLGEGQAAETHQHIVGLQDAENPREHLDKLAEHLGKHNISELQALQSHLGIKATGKKADLAMGSKKEQIGFAKNETSTSKGEDHE